VNRPVITVIFLNGQYYVNYGVTTDGKLKLIDRKGNKVHIETPCIPPRVVKILSVVEFNKCFYFNTKVGVFSCQTGKRVKHTKILSMFVK
jgi:hypothetical protein